MSKDDFRAKLSDDEIKKNHPEISIQFDGRKIQDEDSVWINFLGKRAGRIKANNPLADKKCAEFVENYEVMKKNAQKIIEDYKKNSKI